MRILDTTPEITFDDVLLLPNRGEYTIDEEPIRADVRTRFSRTVELDVPVVAAPMPGVSGADLAVALSECGAIAVLHPFQDFRSQLDDAVAAKKAGARLAVGVLEQSEAAFAHVRDLLREGVDVISVESLQAHNTPTLDFIRRIKDTFPDADVSVGVVTTAEACQDLIEAGADSIRVGIGAGSHCTTRTMTGVGRPLLSTVYACEQVTREHGVPLLADGGVRNPGDLVKALVFGADAVTIGGLFAGTDESPGVTVTRDGQRYKQTWGMCTTTAAQHEQDYDGALPASDSGGWTFEEGVQGLVPAKGPARDVVSWLVSGLRRSMWYQGATSITDLRDRATVVLCSAGTAAETRTRI